MSSLTNYKLFGATNRRAPMEYLVTFIDAVLDAESEIGASTMLVAF